MIKKFFKLIMDGFTIVQETIEDKIMNFVIKGDYIESLIDEEDSHHNKYITKGNKYEVIDIGVGVVYIIDDIGQLNIIQRRECKKVEEE